MKLETEFCKRGELRYISHLDIVRLFQRAVRRAGLPAALTHGFFPHYKIGFDMALKLGIESDKEKAVFTLDKWIDAEEFRKRINEKLPEGVKVLVCRKRF